MENLWGVTKWEAEELVKGLEMELRNYDNWKLDTPKHYDNHEIDCCDEPNIIETVCGCVVCDECNYYSLCYDCGMLEGSNF